MIVVCGSGRTLFEDMVRARHILGKHEVIAVNGAVYGLNGFEHLASKHHDMIHHWRYAGGMRNDCGRRCPAHACFTHSTHADIDVDRVHNDLPIKGGNSVLFAVQVALIALRASEVLLCGAPCDGLGHYYDPPGAGSFPGAWPGSWADAKDLFPGRIHSMSGKTKEFFGDG